MQLNEYSGLDVSRQLRRSAAQVALHWVATQPGVTSPIPGASKLSQLEDNLGALDFSIPAELGLQRDAISAPPSLHPYVFFEPVIQGMIHGGAKVRAWSASRPTQAADARQGEEIGAAK